MGAPIPFKKINNNTSEKIVCDTDKPPMLERVGQLTDKPIRGKKKAISPFLGLPPRPSPWPRRRDRRGNNSLSALGFHPVHRRAESQSGC